MTNIDFTKEELDKFKEYLLEKGIDYINKHPFKKCPYAVVLQQLKDDFGKEDWK